MINYINQSEFHKMMFSEDFYNLYKKNVTINDIIEMNNDIPEGFNNNTNLIIDDICGDVVNDMIS